MYNADHSVHHLAVQFMLYHNFLCDLLEHLVLSLSLTNSAVFVGGHGGYDSYGYAPAPYGYEDYHDPYGYPPTGSGYASYGAAGSW